jgi:signal transduction histidine kinase/DNA-binding response OmpR family regulator
MADEILILDHDKGHANALALYLGRQGAHVRTASAGGEALALCGAKAPGILLADPALPGEDGVALLAQIKQSFPDTYIVVITARENLDRAIAGLRQDVFSCHHKPVGGFTLEMALKNIRELRDLKRKAVRCSEELAEMNRARFFLKQLFDEVPCYISVQDKDFRLTASNRLFKRDFGDKVAGFCYQLYKHRQSPCPDCPVASTFEDGKRHHTEEVVTSRSGEQYNVLTWTAPIWDEEGRITQVMEMSTNITQIRRLQDHLTSLGLMLGSMSHGVKGMLTALDGGIYQLEQGIAKKDEARVRRAHEQIQAMADKIKRMVLDILFYAKSRDPQFQSVDADAFAADLAATVRPLAAKNGVRFEEDAGVDLGSLEGDPAWLASALVNILENAVEACAYDKTKAEHVVEYRAKSLGEDGVLFEISDNGVGMDQETREKMFTLFFSSKGSRGTGLGMFIAHHVIRRHGGTIEVESRPGEGARFRVIIPRRLPKSAAALAQGAEGPAATMI